MVAAEKAKTEKEKKAKVGGYPPYPLTPSGSRGLRFGMFIFLPSVCLFVGWYPPRLLVCKSYPVSLLDGVFICLLVYLSTY
jgi:hypothetical protein